MGRTCGKYKTCKPGGKITYHIRSPY
jgi:hypothetical protein